MLSTWTNLNIRVGLGGSATEPFLRPNVDLQAQESSSTADRMASGTSAGIRAIR
jgi:hypothetical protein